MSAKKHDLSRVQDMAELTPDEFKRMLPDLITWYAFAKITKDVDPTAVVHGFIWVDDNKPGVLTSAVINGKEVDLSGGKA